MKKIIILRGFIAAYLGYTIIQILLGLYIEWQLTPFEQYGPAHLSFITTLIYLIKDVTLLPSLILLFQAVHHFIKRGYFNSISARKLKICGIILMLNSVIEYILLRVVAVYAWNNFYKEKRYSIEWADGLSMLFISLLLGFGLYTLSDFIRRGEAIETENKLTI